MEALIRDLERFSAGIVAEGCFPAAMEGADRAVAVAQVNAPKRTGRFAKSIHVMKGWGVRRNAAFVAVGSNLIYAVEVEYGGKRNKPATYVVGNAVGGGEVDAVVRESLDRNLDEWARKCGF